MNNTVDQCPRGSVNWEAGNPDKDWDMDGCEDDGEDKDDDNDGVTDLWDEHPWDSSQSANITATASLWSGPVEWTAGATTHNIIIASSGYSPDTLTIDAGDTVVWTNTDTTDHTATDSDGGFDSFPITPGGTFSFTFTTAGPYNYSCLFQQFSGQIVVESTGSNASP